MQMSHKNVHAFAGVIFGIAALIHLVALFNKWTIVIGPHTVPTWASVVGVVIAGYLSYRMIQDSKTH